MGALLQKLIPMRIDPVSFGIAGTTTNLEIIFTPSPQTS
jgi:hypothetical protein